MKKLLPVTVVSLYAVFMLFFAVSAATGYIKLPFEIEGRNMTSIVDQPDHTLLTGTDFNVIDGADVSVSSSVAVQTSSTEVIGTSTSRTYLKIVNTGSNYVCLQMDNDREAVDCEGVYLAANGGAHEINSENLYTGAINAIASSSEAIITVYEAN